jgi:hypothetical protein
VAGRATDGSIPLDAALYRPAEPSGFVHGKEHDMSAIQTTAVYQNAFCPTCDQPIFTSSLLQSREIIPFPPMIMKMLEHLKKTRTIKVLSEGRGRRLHRRLGFLDHLDHGYEKIKGFSLNKEYDTF